MVSINGEHLNILAELVNNRICQFIAETDADIVFLAAIHVKHLCSVGCNVLLTVLLFAVPVIGEGIADPLHAIHPEITELLFFAVIGIEIIVTVVPEESVGTDDVLFAALGVFLLLSGRRGIVEVAEANLQILIDSLVDAVGILHNAVVHAPHTVGNPYFRFLRFCVPQSLWPYYTNEPIHYNRIGSK